MVRQCPDLSVLVSRFRLEQIPSMDRIQSINIRLDGDTFLKLSDQV